MKKLLCILMSVILCCVLFSSCKKEEKASEETTEYSGILTKVRLGMDINKIISLQQDGIDLYYETDTEIWSINNDTEIIEVRNLIPAEAAYYYADDSIITYFFNYDSKQDNYFLNGYMQEVTCVLDRPTAEKYFEQKSAQLAAKYGVEAKGKMTGTEGIDQDLVYVKTLNCNTFDVEFTMNLTYDTVNDVDDYYATFFSIKITEAATKTPVDIK